MTHGNSRRPFFGRDGLHHVIGCSPFAFDTRSDIKVAAGQNDPGLFTRAAELLRPYSGEYRRAVVIVDEEWEGSPGAPVIEERLDQHLVDAGWAPPDSLSLVVRPEADAWLWSDSPHSATALGWGSWNELRPALEREGWLANDRRKPERPKEAAEWALRNGARRARRSAAIYRRVAESVSVHRCEDPAVMALLETLREWFPPECA